MSDGERWRGHVDYTDRRVIRGWACDQVHLEQAVLIEAIAESGRKATAFANVFRPDLEAAGIGTGNYGYLIDISDFKKEDGPITVRFAWSKHELTERPVYPDAQDDLMRGLTRGTMPEAFSQAVQFIAYEIDTQYAALRAGSSRKIAPPSFGRDRPKPPVDAGAPKSGSSNSHTGAPASTPAVVDIVPIQAPISALDLPRPSLVEQDPETGGNHKTMQDVPPTSPPAPLIPQFLNPQSLIHRVKRALTP